LAFCWDKNFLKSQEKLLIFKISRQHTLADLIGINVIHQISVEKTVPSALPTEQSCWQRETLYAELYTIILGTAQQQQQNASPVRAAVRFAKLLDVLQQLAVRFAITIIAG